MILRKDGFQNFDNSKDIKVEDIVKVVKFNEPQNFFIQFKVGSDFVNWTYRDLDERDMDFAMLLGKEYFKFVV
jgi:hypothetical protein